jgi:hypothetical protein
MLWILIVNETKAVGPFVSPQIASEWDRKHLDPVRAEYRPIPFHNPIDLVAMIKFHDPR